MKNTLLFFLAFLWSASSFGQDFTYGGINYEVIYVDQLEVFVSNNNDFVGDAIIPETVEYENVTYRVTGIFNDGFTGNADLTSVTIPSSVGSIGMETFKDCINLTSVTIPNTVSGIGSAAFQGCSSLASITIPDSVTFIGENTFKDCINLTSVTIPDSVEYIGRHAFENCSILASVTIPNSVLVIDEAAFQGCSSLASVTIPDSVTGIRDFAFADCPSLASVTISNSVTTIGMGVFYNCSSLASVTIPDSVISIGMGVFANCSSLVSVTIPDSVAIIGDAGFAGCSSLASITIPASMTRLENYTFADCTSLTSVIIPNSITSLGEGVFLGCSSLASVTIPDSVTSIGQEAFVGCSALTSVSVNWETPLVFDSVAPSFDLANLANITLHVPCGTTTSYTEAGWLGFKSISDLAVISVQPKNQTIVNGQAVNFTVTATGVTSYQWQYNTGGTQWFSLSDDIVNPDVSGSASNSLTISGDNMGILSLFKFRVVLNAGACSVTSQEVTVTVKETTLGTSSFEDINFSYYPNPTQGILNITNSKDIQQVTVINMLGKLVQETKPNTSNAKVDLSSLAAGNYLVQVKVNEEIKTIKIIKK